MKKKTVIVDDMTINKRIGELDDYMEELGFDIQDVEPDRETGVMMLKYAMSQPISPYSSLHVSAPLAKFSLPDKEFEKWMEGFKQHMADAGFAG